MPSARGHVEKIIKLIEAKKRMDALDAKIGGVERFPFETDAELRKRLMGEFDLSPEEVSEDKHAPESPEFLKELKDL